MSTNKRHFTVAAALATGLLSCYSQEPPPDLQTARTFVYSLTAHFPGQTKVVRLTGFRMAGTKGIVTALHGVAGASSITAANAYGDAQTGLQLQLVNVERDLVVLQNSDLLNRPSEGFTPCRRTMNYGEAMLGYGHPEGINLHVLHAIVDAPPLVHLVDLVVPDLAAVFDRRQSPSTQIDVLNLRSPMVVGDSGAPLVSTDGKVCGVVDGGLPDAQAEIAWAIPLSPMISWSSAASQSHTIAGLLGPEKVIPPSSRVLFSLQGEEPGRNGQVRLSIGMDGDYHSLQEAVDHVPDGGTILVAEGSYSAEKYNPGGRQYLELETDKSLTIVGLGQRDKTILSGRLRFTKQVHIENVTINGRVVVISGIAEVKSTLVRSKELSAIGVGRNVVATIEDSELDGIMNDIEPSFGYGAVALNASDGSNVRVVKSLLTSIRPKHEAISAGTSGSIKLNSCTIRSEGLALATDGASIEIVDSTIERGTDKYGGSPQNAEELFQQPAGRKVIRWRNLRW